MQVQNLLQYTSSVDDIEEQLHALVETRYIKTHTPLVFEALGFIQRLYHGKLRDNSVPYILHPLRVALMLGQYEERTGTKLLIAALLHDTIKDGDLEDAEIEQRFGHFVAKLVTKVARYTSNTGDTSSTDWDEILLESHEIRALKVFEELDNVMYWRILPVNHALRNNIPFWLEDVRTKYLPLAHATNMQAYELMHQEYTYYVKHGYAHH
ncbi:MAG TPA: HD domain-containing protein [Ktedonobacteraceae bacterium]|jgi:(p)ppGpp synthase/HD superfamily hydrolase|nr:HD domain-containing protein [Ktedonobacteraceae bacterium]